VTSVPFPYAIVRIYGSGKLCADPNFDVSSAFLPLMSFTRSRVFAYLGGLPASFFGASPDRFALRNLSAFD
jgi:hypothetical protein